MSIDELNNAFTESVNRVSEEIDKAKKKREPLSIIAHLKSIGAPDVGYNSVMNSKLEGIKISRQGFEDFIGLLDSNEYIKGYTNGGNDYFGKHPRIHRYDQYYITLGIGTILELSFCETFCESQTVPVASSLNIVSYVCPQDLDIKVDAKTGGFSVIKFLNQDGTNVFDSNTTDEYLNLDGQKLSESLSPISADVLGYRLTQMLQKQEQAEKQM